MTNFRGGIKRTKYDILFSELVRERADWKCEYGQNTHCNNGHRDFRDDGQTLHCSHLFGRRSQGIRTHPNNAFAHCLSCHQFLEENPVIFAEWAREQLGDDLYDRMRYLANKVTKLTKFDKEIIHKHYLSEKKRIKKLRDDGTMGRIEFYLP